jgi:glycosyltransferase involved in cell wall biosynthesis
MPLRVLIVARWYPAHDNPGRGSFVADLIAPLAREGVAVTVASWEHVPYVRDSPAGFRARATALWSPAVRRPDALNVPHSWGASVPVARLPALHSASESVDEQVAAHAASLVPFGSALHDRWPFDLIHAHTGLPDGAAAIQLGSAVDVPVVVTEHDRALRERLPASDEARSAYHRVLEHAALTIAVSARYRDLLCAALNVPKTAIEVLPNALPAVFFSEPLDAPRDLDELLYVGARKENKGMTTLLEAFALARASRPALHLRLIGGSENETEEVRWVRLAESLGVADAVRFDPPCDRAAVAGAMARAGVFVHPSPFESFGMVAAEALAAGLPIAATPSGVEEIVGTDGRAGEIATGLDASSLAGAIDRVLERRSQFRPERQRQVVARFEASTVARELITRYRSVIEAHSGKRTNLSMPGPGQTRSLESRPFTPPLVIGLNRPIAERRLSLLPPALSSTLVFLTQTSEDRRTEPAVGRTIEIDLKGQYRARLAALGSATGTTWSLGQRVWHFLRSPRAALTRRRLRRDPRPFMLEAAQRGVLEAWIAAAQADGAPRPLLALDLDALLASEKVIARGGELAPGGTRWLADLWDGWRAETPSAR